MKQRLDRDTIAMRAAKELKDGDCVNLGFGLPTLCALYVPEGIRFQTESGILGYGPLVLASEIEKADWRYIDASGRFCTPVPGMAVFDVLVSFAMIRSGRLIAIMGGFQVSEKGDLANWNTGDDALGGTIGGAMDLAVGSKKVIITMEHNTKDGGYRLVKNEGWRLSAREKMHLSPYGKGTCRSNHNRPGCGRGYTGGAFTEGGSSGLDSGRSANINRAQTHYCPGLERDRAIIEQVASKPPRKTPACPL